MALDSEENRIIYVGNNSNATLYPITFRFDDNDWLNVTRTDADGTATVLTEGLSTAGFGQFEVVEDSPDNFNIRSTVAVPVASTLTISRRTPAEQTLILIQNSPIPAKDLEAALDRLIMALQDRTFSGSNPFSSALLFPVDEDPDNLTILPSAAARKGKYIFFNASTGEMELAEATDGLIPDATTIETSAGALRIKDNGISNAKLAQVATGTIKGRRTAATGNVEDITLANLLADLVALGTLAQTPLVVSGNVTATLGRTHHLTASATITDPAGVEGGVYIVKILAGTATIDGVTYSTVGSIIERSYLSAAWQTTRVYINGPQFLAAQSATGAETLFDFTGIPENVKRITVSFAALSTNGTSNIIIQIGDSGGIENTGYAGGLALDGVSSSITAAFGAVRAPSASSNYNGSIILTRYNATSFYWIATGAMAGNTGEITTAAGSKLLSAALDRLRVTTAAGVNTFDAGGVSVMYEF